MHPALNVYTKVAFTSWENIFDVYFFWNLKTTQEKYIKVKLKVDHDCLQLTHHAVSEHKQKVTKAAPWVSTHANLGLVCKRLWRVWVEVLRPSV